MGCAICAHIHPTPARPSHSHEPQPRGQPRGVQLSQLISGEFSALNCAGSIPNCRTEATAAANDAKSGGIQIITIAVRDSSTELDFLFTLNSTNLGFVAESFEEAELVTDAILGEIDIPCPP